MWVMIPQTTVYKCSFLAVIAQLVNKFPVYILNIEICTHHRLHSIRVSLLSESGYLVSKTIVSLHSKISTWEIIGKGVKSSIFIQHSLYHSTCLLFTIGHISNFCHFNNPLHYSSSLHTGAGLGRVHCLTFKQA